jgi:microsomal epoxide hydrolase
MMSFTKLPATAKISPTPFNAAVPDSKIQELKTLLKFARLATPTYESSRSDRKFGVTREWISQAKAEWESLTGITNPHCSNKLIYHYSRRKFETHLNTFPQYLTPITDTDGAVFKMHFLALFSEKPDAVPILMLHGWPGSFLEFLPLLSILSTRYNPTTLPYHIVVPSLPGYAFSSPAPLNRDFQLQDVARLLNTLMVQLGFADGYVVQGGDIGSQIGRILVSEHANCKGDAEAVI